MRLLASVLLIALSGNAKETTNKQYTKEVEGIYKADSTDISSYNRTDLDAQIVSMHVTLIKWDLYLLHQEIFKFKHHHSSRKNVDARLGQLERDLENAP